MGIKGSAIKNTLIAKIDLRNRLFGIFLPCQILITMTKAENTKQRILETAGPLYNAKGINGTAIDDVLDAANVTKGCLYSHF